MSNPISISDSSKEPTNKSSSKKRKTTHLKDSSLKHFIIPKDNATNSEEKTTLTKSNSKEKTTQERQKKIQKQMKQQTCLEQAKNEFQMNPKLVANLEAQNEQHKIIDEKHNCLLLLISKKFDLLPVSVTVVYSRLQYLIDKVI